MTTSRFEFRGATFSVEHAEGERPPEIVKLNDDTYVNTLWLIQGDGAWKCMYVKEEIVGVAHVVILWPNASK